MRFMNFKVAMTVVMSILVGGSAALAAESPAVVNKAHALIHKEQSDILKTAYPTAGRMLEDTTGAWYETRAGYALDEKFIYTDSGGDRQTFTLRFYLDSKGNFTSMTETNRSEMWPTFGTGNLILIALQSNARDQIQSARARGVEPPAMAVRILELSDIKEVVVLSLNMSK